MTTLIIGLRGCGKSTKAKEVIDQDGLAYDMDAIASAFRLRMPHEEYHRGARHMANDLLMGFRSHAYNYTENIVIIRTAPFMEEVEKIAPNKIIWMRTRYVIREMDNEQKSLIRIAKVLEWGRSHNVKIEIC